MSKVHLPLANYTRNPATDLEHKKILLVDRNNAVRAHLRQLVVNLGAKNIHMARNYTETIKAVKNHVFDIILCDYDLEEHMDGQQMLEDLRKKHLIRLDTIFMIVTGETEQRKVASVAELGPDDYLVKPFTSDQLHTRLEKTLIKKHIFRTVYAYIENGNTEGAVCACHSIVVSHPSYRLDAWRMEAELLISMQRSEEAYALYEKVASLRAVPWAKMGIAKALRVKGELQRAKDIVEEVLARNQHYTAAYDFLAELEEELGDLTSAEQYLVKGTEIAPNNVSRQRKLGDVAVKTGNYALAQKALTKALTRVGDDVSKTMEDTLKLLDSKAQILHAEELDQHVATTVRSFRGRTEMEPLTALMQSRLAFSKEDPVTGYEYLSKAVERIHQLRETDGIIMSAEFYIETAGECLRQNLDEMALKLLKDLVFLHGDTPEYIERINKIFEECGKENTFTTALQEVNKELTAVNNRAVLLARENLDESVRIFCELAERTGGNIQILANAIKAIVAKLDKNGWNDLLAEQAKGYLRRAVAVDEVNPKTVSAMNAWRKTALNFGMSPKLS